MKYNELKKGEIYTVIWSGSPEHIYIIQAGTGHNIWNNQAFYKGGEFSNQKDGYELASYEQAQWLRECIKQNKLVLFEKIKLEYEIY